MALILPLPVLHDTSYQQFDELPEQELWNTLRQGNEAALAFIHRSYYKSLYRYGLKLSQDADLSEDCIQDLFVTLWTARSNISAVQSIKLYLFTSYRRLILQHKKNRQKALNRLFYQPDVVFSSEEVMMKSEADQQTTQNFIILLNSLPKRQKEALYLRYYEDLSFTEVAQLMDVSYQSVLNHIQRALNNIRQRPDLAILLGRSSFKLSSS
ncbi:sigma-70 family RNA polymerase sigma factor [Adhaeribacter swui]|uniref:Sigma-70 family RNA polymerase sigma factor n=1 Tax=Adhaeribacter swui TaxID=2086471 RepID=A0A7G7G2T1_9BACT|nr:sigma-70 family RNA polymerase sigma factor [Adhaeribacter swui]QNF31465.1 sigma-70 family RNA polymerase sigma factor [Adhaeribacter swui]